MSESTQSSEQGTPEPPAHGPPDTQSPGEILREGRLAHDWSIEDLCAETKLSEKSVRALENNAFNELSQPIFAGGYYRQCAKILDIDTERMMAAYAAWGGKKTSSQTATPEAMDVVPQDVTPHNWGAYVAIGAIALLAILGGLFVFMPDAGPDESKTADRDDTAPAVSDEAPTGDSAGTSADSASAGSTTIGSGNSSATSNGRPSRPDTPEPGVTGRASPESAASASTGRRSGGRNVNDTLGIDREAERRRRDQQSAPEPQVAANHLVVTFTDRSWVDIRGADGSRLLRGIYESGETREFDADAPYRITLGYAPGVDMTIGGQAVDIDSQTTDNSTARLTVEARDDRNE